MLNVGCAEPSTSSKQQPAGGAEATGSGGGSNSNGGGGNGSNGISEGHWRVLGLKISKDDVITITAALAISYGIRW